MIKILDELRSKALQLKKEHPQCCIDKVRVIGDKEKVSGIIITLKRESQQWQYQQMCIWKMERKCSKYNMFQDINRREQVCSARSELEGQTIDHLIDIFTGAHSSPFCLRQLLTDLGYMGNETAIDGIVHNNKNP